MHSQRIGLSLGLGFFMALFGVPVAHGQGFPSRYGATSGMLIPAPREVESLLEEARDAISREQWSEATLALGTILGLEGQPNNADSGQDYFLLSERGENVLVQGSVVRAAHELLTKLPKEGEQTIELRYGVRAKQMLEEAVAAWDWRRIQQVASRYGFTFAGQEAMLMIAERALGEGNTREAASNLVRLLRIESARKRFGESLGLLTIAVTQAANMKGEAREALNQIRTETPSFSTDWKGVKLGWNEKTSDEAILQSLYEKQFSSILRPVTRPLFPGGDPRRNADTTGGLPLPILRWHVELHESLQHKESLEKELKKQVADRRSVLIPTRYPIAVDSLILVPSYDQRVLAIDARTGVIAWPCVFSGLPLGFSLDRFDGRESQAFTANENLVRRVWGETSSGQIASDGERLFTLSEMPAVDVAESFARGPNARMVRNMGIRTFNVMQAWSIREQGKILWETGGDSGGNSPDLAGALFLGAPLPHQGELLTLIELNGEIFLVSLSPGNGRLLWKQPIAANQGMTISLDPQRRSYGASPTAEGSVILCPTLSGYLIAYDMNSRELLWQYEYPMNPELNQGASFNFIGGMDNRESKPIVPRSVDTFVVIHDGVAVFAPSNGNIVAGISIADGKELWQIRFDDPNPFRYIAGVYGDTVALVQSNSVVAVDLRTGARKWNQVAMPDNALVVGRSVRKGDQLLVPTSNQEIVQVDLTKGSIAGTVRAIRPLGNLLAVDDRLISTSPFQMDCYTIRTAFETRLQEELARDGETVRNMVKRGEIHIASGNIDAALEVLEKAFDTMPTDPEVRMRLFEASSIALRENFVKYVDRVQRYQPLTLDLELPAYLRILIHGLQKQGRWEQSLVKLLELSDTRIIRRIDQMSDGENLDLSPRWSVQEDRWIAACVARCVENLSAESLRKLEPQILARLEPSANVDRGVLLLRLEHLQSIPQSEKLRLYLANLLMQANALEAELILNQAPTGSLSPALLSSERKEALAHVYLQAKHAAMALRAVDGDRDQLARLGKQLNFDEGFLESTGAVPPRDTGPFLSPNSSNVSHVWPNGRVDVSAVFKGRSNPGAFTDTALLCSKGESLGNSLDDWQIFFETSGCRFVNPLSGQEITQYIDSGALERSAAPRVHSVDSLVLLEFRNQIIAINPLLAGKEREDGPLWRTPSEELTPEAERARGRSRTSEVNVWGLATPRRLFQVAAVTRHGVVVLMNDDLRCLDLISGQPLWTLSGFRSAAFIHEGDTLVAFQPSTNSIVHIDVRDGLILKTVEHVQPGWTPLVSVGRKWIFSPERNASGDRANEMQLRMIDPSTGDVLLQRKHTPATRLAVIEDYGLAAMNPDGELTYWNVNDALETTYKVEVEGEFGTITAQRFGEVALILPYARSMELDGFQVNPSSRNDPSVATCAGRLFAISVKDGRPVWHRSQRVKHFLFPLSQDRDSPAAVFLRRLTLSKVRGIDLDFTSIALVDVTTGRLLYQKHDLPALRQDPFSQKLIPSENTMMFQYQGNEVTAKWTGDDSELPDSNQSQEIGDLNIGDFRAAIEAKLDEEAARNPAK